MKKKDFKKQMLKNISAGARSSFRKAFSVPDHAGIETVFVGIFTASLRI